MNLNMHSFILRHLKNHIVPFVEKRFYCSATTNVHDKVNFLSKNAARSNNIQNEESTNEEKLTKSFSQLSEFRFIYPEFLPDPKYEFRNKIREKMERSDMLKRRKVIYIPEFYVGSILAVTATDPYAPGKKKKFVGICIQRTYAGLRATFTLRNVVDGQGVEIMYDMYNPTILSIEVLRLEKRLDDELLYLRDAGPEYSTFPFDMEPEFHPEGKPVPVNPIKVKLKPYPWHLKWEQRNMRGIENVDDIPVKKKWVAKKNETPWEKYDLMKEYRRCISEEDQYEIWKDVDEQKDKFPSRSHVWKKTLLKAPRKAPR